VHAEKAHLTIRSSSSGQKAVRNSVGLNEEETADEGAKKRQKLW